MHIIQTCKYPKLGFLSPLAATPESNKSRVEIDVIPTTNDGARGVAGVVCMAEQAAKEKGKGRQRKMREGC